VRIAAMLRAGIVSIIFVVCAMTIMRAQDLAKVSPQQATVVLENDRVRVLRLVYKPGEKVPLHTHPAVVVIYMTRANLASNRPITNLASMNWQQVPCDGHPVLRT